MSSLIAITIDYETWHPVPDDKIINWENDIFQPFEVLLKLFDQEKIKVTFMAEMGEYFWLKQNDPKISKKMEQQWIDAIHRGHDVQLHLHPSWLPELGAGFQDGRWIWDWSKSKANDFPGNLTALLGKCVSTLESILCPIDSTYKVSSFRAGAYQVQPFKRLYDALTANGIYCDSSVYSGGYSEERGYDFHLSYSNHQPYFASAYDPQLKAPPIESGIVEIPVFTFKPNQRWILDGREGEKFASRLFGYLKSKEKNISTDRFRRQKKWGKCFLEAIYHRLKPFHHWINFIIPRPIAHFMTRYRSELLVTKEYFVMIGHTKGEHDFNAIAENLRMLKEDGRFEFVTLSEMAKMAKRELSSRNRQNAKEEADYQVIREYKAVLGDIRNAEQSYYLQDMIPMDRNTLLDLGCGAGYWSYRISTLYPWMKVVGIDWGLDFIAKAKNSFSSERLYFKVEDFANLSFLDESFDCVYADNILEHAYDVDKTLQEVYRVLIWRGVFVAAIPSDARNPKRICENHTWKTVPHEVRMRFENAGFTNIEIHEIDTFRKLGMPPYPPSNDKMMYIKAWKRPKEISKLERAIEAMNWVYRNLSPEKSSQSSDPTEIITSGHAFCWGYTVVLGKLLQKEGFPVKWITMLAKNHPKGRGNEKIDSHEVLLINVNGRKVILDPMANTYLPYSLSEILRNPELAVKKECPDRRYTERDYYMYDTEFWYGRVFKYTLRSSPNTNLTFWKKNRYRS